MAKKTFIGRVKSTKMQNTVVVEIERFVKHPIYKKMLRRTTNLKADTAGMALMVGQNVKIEQTRPMSRDKNFKVIGIIKEGAKSV
ncbi:MAG TPA: 30S ribosomal protein S17 [Patescibacteria group bacterium]|nr:30S ribosomal protein S17 [Patescibacteria group bacterium]